MTAPGLLLPDTKSWIETTVYQPGENQYHEGSVVGVRQANTILGSRLTLNNCTL